MSICSSWMIRHIFNISNNPLSIIFLCKNWSLWGSIIHTSNTWLYMFFKLILTSLLIFKYYTFNIIYAIWIYLVTLNYIDCWTNCVFYWKPINLSSAIWSLISGVCNFMYTPDWDLLITCGCSRTYLLNYWSRWRCISKSALAGGTYCFGRISLHFYRYL